MGASTSKPTTAEVHHRHRPNSMHAILNLVIRVSCMFLRTTAVEAHNGRGPQPQSPPPPHCAFAAICPPPTPRSGDHILRITPGRPDTTNTEHPPFAFPAICPSPPHAQEYFRLHHHRRTPLPTLHASRNLLIRVSLGVSSALNYPSLISALTLVNSLHVFVALEAD